MDDDASIREVVQAVIEVEGYPVVTAADGAEALDRLRGGLRPGVILLDLRMPGMDGRAFRDLQGAEPELAAIPVVILSGDSDAPGVASGLGVEWLLKPVDLDRLLSVVERHCAPPARSADPSASRSLSEG
ncbi:response regulator [Anaeromyxobacter oryzae]|uniref:response regulator n=1 Tax=Anaeromyxobacter oryzae TaxID=2918170 RepID=UPI0020BF12C6|nr:response regulator [Anaeromyxobacter oryzae]